MSEIDKLLLEADKRRLAIYLACDETVAKDVSEHLGKLSDIVKVLRRELERVGDIELETMHGPTIRAVCKDGLAKAEAIALVTPLTRADK